MGVSKKAPLSFREGQKISAPDPKKLDECTFFKRLGFELSAEQKKFRDAIYDPNIDIVFSNSPAGGGLLRPSVHKKDSYNRKLADDLRCNRQ